MYVFRGIAVLIRTMDIVGCANRLSPREENLANVGWLLGVRAGHALQDQVSQMINNQPLNSIAWGI
jgi:hypothetical protein